MHEHAIHVNDLGKRYQIDAPRGQLEGQAGLRHVLDGALKGLSRRLTGRGPASAVARTRDFWALRNVTFDVKRGECVGVIGRNGAGKSTLLKVLSRITEPTEGEVRLKGRVGSLLEVGTGFHLELSGRENIFLNGSILGMSRREVLAKFDEIVAFSEVGQFLDTPVKRYSSGMYLRLAFAVAAHLEPEILIVDEVLAVGDAQFQKKCLGKMGEVSGHGRTVLFVSHNMASVHALCHSAIVLSGGRVDFCGPTDRAVKRYMELGVEESVVTTEPNEHGVALRHLRLVDTETRLATSIPVFDRDYELDVVLTFDRPIEGASVYVTITDDLGVLLATLCGAEEGIDPSRLFGEVQCTFRIPRLDLIPRSYVAGVFVERAHDAIHYIEVENALRFEVQASIVNNGMWAYQPNRGYVRLAQSAVQVSQPLAAR